MADVLTTKTQVDATVEEIVSTQVQEVLVASAVMPGSILDMSSQVSPGMDKLKIPKFGSFTVDSKVSGTAVDAQTNAFSTDDLDLDQHNVIQFLLEDIANIQSKVAVFDLYVSQAARDLAAKIDADVIDSIEAGTSAAAPDHRIAYANSGTDNNLQKEDILEAKRLLNVQNVPMEDRFLLIAPGSEKSLLNVSEFVRVDESGNDGALRNGQIGRLFGFTVLMSSQAEDLKTLAYHRSCHAFAQQMAPKTEMDRDLANLSDRWSISVLWGQKHLDAGKRAVMLGTAA